MRLYKYDNRAFGRGLRGTLVQRKMAMMMIMKEYSGEAQCYNSSELGQPPSDCEMFSSKKAAGRPAAASDDL